jgi:DNA uptake protein ComE-like DNA-binding protein
MSWRGFLNDFFSYSKKERTGIFIIIAIVFIIIISPNFFQYIFKKEKLNTDDFKKDIASLSVKADTSERNYYQNDKKENANNNFSNTHEAVPSELFYFDPNTATYDEWERLGIKDKTIHTIQHYISKGGKFYKPDDIRKIWGMSSTDAQRLIPYIDIKNKNTDYTATLLEKKNVTPPAFASKGKVNTVININTADTSVLKSLPGIGSRLSARIVAFRDKLGGFYSIDQVSETYMLPDSTFQKIKPMLTIGNTAVKQININIATIDEMKSHPYLRYNLANAIFQYRRQHGNYNTVEDVKKIMLITDDVYKKVLPYLTVQ